MLYKQPHNLKILQWNAQGATTQAVISQLDHLLNEENIDIAAVSETFLTTKHKFQLNNYAVYRNDRPTHGGGVLIAVKNTIVHKRLQNITTTVAENVSIQVTIDKALVTFTSAYIPKYSSNFAKDICKLTPKNRNFVVLGDFNAKHVAWNCLANNRAGNVLFNMLHKADFVMHHPDTFTHHPHCGSTPSVIDFALTNSPIIYSNVYTLDGSLPSDHNPVIFHIQGTPPETMPNARPNYKKADWDKFVKVIENQLTSFDTGLSTETEIDTSINKFINAMRIAESEAVPKEIPKNKKAKISPPTIELIKLRNDTQSNVVQMLILDRCTEG